MIDTPPAIIHPAPTIHWTVKTKNGHTVYVWCGQIVDEDRYWELLAQYVRTDGKEKCPKGRF